MDWDELLDIEEEWEEIRSPPKLGPMRTKAYWAARKRRVARLRQEIEQGTYRLPPAEEVAWYILHGPLKWGEALIDDEGKRIDQGRVLSCG